MKEFDKIHLVWRKGTGGRRYSVGLLQRTADGSHIFKYAADAAQLQKEEGFTPYTEFQDLHKEYNGNVAEIFGQRLIKTDRPDIGSFFKFWEVDTDKANDKFYLLGKTQGLVATDNFEFLAEYKLTSNTHFLTELASMSVQQLQRGALKEGDKLRFEKEPDNEYDCDAIKVFKENLFIGYIKKYHNKIFCEPGAESLSLTVKALEQNGIIKRIFVKVSL
jgi:hypothetical protein